MRGTSRLTVYRSVVGLALVLCLSPCAVGQRMYEDAFDDDAVSWSVRFLPNAESSTSRVTQHRRERADWKHEGMAEVLRFETSSRNQRAALDHALPPARPFEELTLKLRVRSNQEGLRLAVRLVFEDHRHPRSGKPLTTLIRGDIYRRGNEWQELACRADHDAVAAALRELRAETSLPLPVPGQTHVDAAILICDFNPGQAEILLDDLRFGPVIDPVRSPAVADVAAGAQAAVTHAELRLGSLRVDGRPFFPRMTPLHDEPPALMQAMGVNTLLVPDSQDVRLLKSIADAGLWAAAVPPMPLTSGLSESLFPAGSDRVLFWYLGTRVPAGRQQEVRDWSRQLGRIDPLRRPTMADVTSAGRIYSRHLDLLGLSTPILGTSLSLRDYRDLLLQRRSMAQPGKFAWTWIQTEAPEIHATRSGHPFVVEPEQLRLQAYAAIASGSKALGYWKRTSLAGSGPGAAERRLMLQQLNLELSLMEDWLATSKLVSTVRCEKGAGLHPSSGGNKVRTAWETEQQRKSMSWNPLAKTVGSRVELSPVEAAVFTNRRGRLLLPVWYAEDAQFVPDEMVADDLSLVVHVYETERAAWLVTTTGIRSLPAHPQPGGLRVHLSTADGQTLLDQTAMVVITSQQEVIADLRRRVSAMAETSATTQLQLATAKRDRVRSIEAELDPGGSSSAAVLRQADAALSRASEALERQSYDQCARQARHAMRVLRRLQHWRWQRATGRQPGVFSPHTVSYQTLPDHYRLMQRLKSQRPQRTVRLLPELSGTAVKTLSNTGWSRFPGRLSGIRAEAQFLKGRDRYSLALLAIPEQQSSAPEVVADPPMRVMSPILSLNAGDVVHVRGRVRLPAPIAGSVNAAMIFDSLLGPAGALRWRDTTDGWEEFDFVREAQDDSSFYLTFLLSGLGQLQVADLEAAVYPAETSAPALASEQRLLKP